jgi:hypothetical protein
MDRHDDLKPAPVQTCTKVPICEPLLIVTVVSPAEAQPRHTTFEMGISGASPWLTHLIDTIHNFCHIEDRSD